MSGGIKIYLLRLTALLCAVLCLFSAVMSGTYAWESKQAVTNDLRGTADVLMPVVLMKLEKGGDAPIQGAAFYLYRDDGEQIGGRYVTDVNGMICVELPLGSYYFEEAAPALGYTYDADAEGKAITQYHFTVVEQSEPIVVYAYNLRLSGDLIISKTVENEDGTPLSEIQQQTEFTFTVNFSDEGTYAYSIDNGEPQSFTSGGALTLCHGQSAVFEDLPFGLLYNVAETPAAGYTTRSSGHQGNITAAAPAMAEFVNVWQGGGSGSLTVTKTVVGENIDPETGEDRAKLQEFTFAATIGGVDETFTLKHGESKVFDAIGLGTAYRVSEQPCEGYTADVALYEGTVNAAEAVTLPFVNTYRAEIPTGTGSLTITKTVTGLNTACTDSFTFLVQFSGEGAPEDTSVVLNGMNSYAKTITDIPVGVSYTVTEVLTQGYLPVWMQRSGTIYGDETAAFINRAQQEPVLPDGDPVIIAVTKALAGEVLKSDGEREFRMTLLADGKVESFTLKGGDSATFGPFPYGTVYELREDDYVAEGFSQSITNGSGIATEDTDIVVTNTYVDTPRVEISGEKTWVVPQGMNITLPESVAVRLLDGKRIVEEQTVTPNDEDKWHYTFVAPKYRADGTEIVYAVEEVPVAGFYASYEGYNIVNTYVVPVADNDPPVIIKKIKGDNAPLSAFTFVFAGQQGAPMPVGSVGYQKEMSITGGGEVEIGVITFTEAGTYVYTVHEKHGGEKGWTYDSALYTITYEVTQDPVTHQLSVARTIAKNETAVDSIVFTNRYNETVTEMVTISGVKTWVHRNNPVANRPTSVIIEVYGDGQRVFQKSLTEQDDWRYSVDLPKYADDGHAIVYTVDEQPVRGYNKKISGYDITNTYVTPYVPNIPDVPDTPDEPEKPESSAPTGDDSRILFWMTMTLASMLGGVAAMRILRNGQYVGKRLYTGKRLKKK